MLKPFLGWLGLGPEAKAARTHPPPLASTLAFYATGRPIWTPRDYGALAREGFQRNAVVHRAVRLVAEAAASIPLTLIADGQGVETHPELDLLAAPNRREAGTRFLEGVYGHLMVSGNAYLQAGLVDGMPRELYGLRPDRMRVVPGPDGWPEAYDYAVGARTLRFEQEGEGIPPILHLTLFHPVDDHYGLSPMEAAAVALDIHNAAGAWNKALLDNAARPSGALVFAGPAGGSLSDTQFDRLKTELAQNYQGAAHAGRPLLLDGGLDWKPLSLSPKDMDFVEAKNGAAREIALAFGVPPLLLGLAGDNTHANYAEANRAFYRQTVIPLARRSSPGADSMAWARLRPEPPARARPRCDRGARGGAGIALAPGRGRHLPRRERAPGGGGLRAAESCRSRRPARGDSMRPAVPPRASPAHETKLLADPGLVISRTGEFEGYASLFGVPDLGRDMVLPGAFRDSLLQRGPAAVRMLWQHDPAEPIGRWIALAEDARGLRVRGRLNGSVARAREVAALLQDGGVDGLSIGFRVVEADRDRAKGIRRLRRIDLWEISVVTFPMLPGARISAAPAIGTEARPIALAIRRAASRLSHPAGTPAPTPRTR